MNVQDFELILRLFLAVLIGGIVGFEREIHQRPAGFRTHILVCLGSTLIMITSLEMHNLFGASSDPGRIAAQVVSGIGFLGAGTILREGVTIRGLTTAASLWATAAIGLSIGAGLYLYGIMGAGLLLLTLWSLSTIEFKSQLKNKIKQLEIKTEDKPGVLGALALILGQNGVDIRNVRFEPQEITGTITIVFEVKTLPDQNFNALTSQLMECKGVVEVLWNN